MNPLGVQISKSNDFGHGKTDLMQPIRGQSMRLACNMDLGIEMAPTSNVRDFSKGS